MRGKEEGGRKQDKEMLPGRKKSFPAVDPPEGSQGSPQPVGGAMPAIKREEPCPESELGETVVKFLWTVTKNAPRAAFQKHRGSLSGHNQDV